MSGWVLALALASVAHADRANEDFDFACGYVLAKLTGTVEHLDRGLRLASDEHFVRSLAGRRAYRYVENPDRAVRSEAAAQDFPRAVIADASPNFHRTLRPCPPAWLEDAERSVRSTPGNAYLERLGRRHQHVTCVYREAGHPVGLIQAWTEHVGLADTDDIIARERVYLRSTRAEWHLLRDVRRRLVRVRRAGF